MKSILLVGDSYAAGRIPHTDKDGALEEALKKLFPVTEIVNYAVSGSLAKDWNTGSLRVKLAEIIGMKDCVTVLSLGGNDMFSAISDGIVTLKEIKDFLRDTMCVATSIAQAMPTYMFIYPLPQFMGKAKISQYAHKVLKLALLGVAYEAGAVPIDLSEVLTHDDDFDGADIHPSISGYGRIAEAIKDAIDKTEEKK